MLNARHHRLRPSLVFGPRLGVGWGFAQVPSPLLSDALIICCLSRPYVCGHPRARLQAHSHIVLAPKRHLSEASKTLWC